MRLRQIALVASELAPVKQQIFALLGLDDDFKDVGVGEFGLENSVMAIGDTYLEVVAPITENTTAGRLLERRGGDGGYMFIAQTDDLALDSDRINKLGIRKVWEANLSDAKAFHMHPRDVGAAITSIDQMTPPESWRWAGPNWESRGAKLVEEIVAVEIQTDAVAEMAQRWAKIFDGTIDSTSDGNIDSTTNNDATRTANESVVVRLDRGEIRFVKATDGRGDGICAVDFRTNKLNSVLEKAKEQNLEVSDNRVTVCGTHFYFVS